MNVAFLAYNPDLVVKDTFFVRHIASDLVAHYRPSCLFDYC